MTTTAKGLSIVGSLVVLAPLTALVAARLVHRRRWFDAVSLVASVVGVVAIQALVKVVVARPRPTASHLVAVTSGSFPSQHAAQAAAVAWALALLLSTRHRPRTVLLIAASLFAVAVGLSRIYLGVHYPSDVAAGWALGVGWVLIVVRVGSSHQPAAPGTDRAVH